MYDAATGLVRFGVRDYDAQTGKWTAKDPIGFGGEDTDLYSYAGNDPVNRIDPSGRIWWFVVAAVVSAAVDLTLQLATNGGNLDCVDWWSVGISAVTGAIGMGAGARLAQVGVAGARLVAANVGVGAVLGAGSQLGLNAAHGESAMNGVGTAALYGGVLGGALGAAGGKAGSNLGSSLGNRGLPPITDLPGTAGTLSRHAGAGSEHLAGALAGRARGQALGDSLAAGVGGSAGLGGSVPWSWP